ncbi:MAG: topoisomerase DNA-binding C4 zinc finger domain-containing protein, partial [Marinosulfonomonas sp.]|nr:topoisomerase DNA-binding C4 zinc finger domain-containing protein [Marinosulfonomonas sp.]
APFMTSTLQQEASRKFGFGARQTMSCAQRLYEAGLITYMRTDGIDMAPEAITATRDAIKDRFGDSYLPNSPRIYKNKAKNAQEAHECIRPTDLSKSTEQLKISDADQRKLYDLIYKRTIASQMAAARMERTTVDVASADGQVELRATGQVVLFDGFMKIYEEGRDDAVVDDDDKRLPQIMEGEAADKRSVTPEQHFTQPPPRYTEASLVKRMEELGIGRPSTYASIVTTIQDREYVTKDKNRLIPEDKGRLVTIFLLNYFRQYVGYEFTANLEEQLDDVSAGNRDYKEVLSRFWRDFAAAVAETADLRIREVLDKIDEVLEPHVFPPTEDGSDPRVCKKCGDGRLGLKTARSGGAFIGCSNYPECRFTRPLAAPTGDEGEVLDGKILGEDSGDEISLRDGRFGPYVQRGEPTEDVPKPPRASLPKGWEPANIDLEKALMLLALPREIGPHPDDGVMVEAGIGRYGPFVKHDRLYANLPDVEEVFTVGMNRAVEVLAQKLATRGGGRAAAKPLVELGEHPDKGGAMNVMDGRYGPYVKWEKVNATLPKGTEPGDVSVAMAVELVDAKAAKKGGRKKAAPKKKKAAATKKPSAKKKPAAKKPAKKSAAKE